MARHFPPPLAAMLRLKRREVARKGRQSEAIIKIMAHITSLIMAGGKLAGRTIEFVIARRK
jgi:hypothetical protein